MKFEFSGRVFQAILQISNFSLPPLPVQLQKHIFKSIRYDTARLHCTGSQTVVRK